MTKSIGMEAIYEEKRTTNKENSFFCPHLQLLYCMSDLLDWGFKTLSTRLAGSLCCREVGTFTMTGLLLSCPAHQSNTRLPGFFAVTLLLLQWLRTDFLHYFRLVSLCLIRLISR